jgi:adenylate cyclase
MSVEIERKFLLASEQWRHGAHGIPYAQGYLSRGTGRTVRVRIAGSEAFLTIKGPVTGISRAEFEYSIPVEEAREMLSLCEGLMIEKIRYRIPHAQHVWEVDEFQGENWGLLIAEVEMKSPEEVVALPAWVGKEVTGDPRYYNSNLTIHPYREWSGEAV